MCSKAVHAHNGTEDRSLQQNMCDPAELRKAAISPAESPEKSARPSLSKSFHVCYLKPDAFVGVGPFGRYSDSAAMSSFQAVLQNDSASRSPFGWVAHPTILNAAQPWLSPSQQELFVNALLPGCAGLLLLLYDLLSSIRFHKSIRTVFRRLASPFRDFLTLEDLEEEPHRVDAPEAWKARVLVLGSALESAVWICVLVYGAVVEDKGLSVQAAVAATTWLYIVLRVLFKPPVTPPYLLIVLYLVHATIALVDLLQRFIADERNAALTTLVLLQLAWPTALAWVAGSLPLRSVLPAQNVAKHADVPTSAATMPEDSVTLWSWSTFSFVEPLFKVATARTLDEADVWSLSPYFKHNNLFKKYLRYQEEHPTHSLLWFLLASNSLDLSLDLLLELWSAVFGFVPPYALQEILSALANPSPASTQRAYFWAIMTFLANLSFAQVDLYQNWYTRRCYERTRGQLFCALHYKALRRRDVGGKTSHNDKEDDNADLGRIVNLMQGDAYAVANRFWQFSGFFLAPIRLTIALIFLYRILGWSSLAAVVVVVVAYVLNYPLAKYNVYVTRQSWTARDSRMNLVNELFQNIRFLKYYGWEHRWSARVREARETELKWRVKDNIVSVFITFIWTWIPSATAVASFLCYTLIAGERLTVAKAFTSIALFSYIQEPMTLLPEQFFALLHAYVSMQRIEKFLAEAEVPEWASTLKMAANPAASLPDEVGFEDAVFEWDVAPRDVQSRFRLGPLNVEFPKDRLTLVSGATGSGKSALLAALLGEMHCISGKVILNKAGHQVAYCAQNPWLEHATIRDNIIFGAAYGYDEKRYRTVIEACALNRDLEIFEAAT
ncbi:ABC transporter type 1, transmembrane domain-containing protein [Fomitopsis serialis]|uniref:ABC transporter type 1, transmembrane domain-containing protein n=1 Tax=Fomitopsis serialis TaxID=139415 RepID=UPI002008818F|nr:ABC transporter type 1, transmembrane domain-containing protein [Neoantrodia serialis]KAH9906597.1 ABC transporter type 1, transmembrane domain-containing protein [Neoantrodia serialis]